MHAEQTEEEAYAKKGAEEPQGARAAGARVRGHSRTPTGAKPGIPGGEVIWWRRRRQHVRGGVSRGEHRVRLRGLHQEQGRARGLCREDGGAHGDAGAAVDGGEEWGEDSCEDPRERSRQQSHEPEGGDHDAEEENVPQNDGWGRGEPDAGARRVHPTLAGAGESGQGRRRPWIGLLGIRHEASGGACQRVPDEKPQVPPHPVPTVVRSR